MSPEAIQILDSHVPVIKSPCKFPVCSDHEYLSTEAIKILDPPKNQPNLHLCMLISSMFTLCSEMSPEAIQILDQVIVLPCMFNNFNFINVQIYILMSMKF